MKDKQKEEHVYVHAKDIPNVSELNAKVRDVVSNSSWYDKYGADWLQFIGITCLVPVALIILRSADIVSQVLGLFLLCLYHTSLTARAGHIASHGGLCDSPRLNYFLHYFLGEFIGSFSTKCGHDIHIKMHHPHTNIIGLGDSSTWKAPFLPRYIYMFIAPLALPLLIPLVSLQMLLSERDWKNLMVYLMIAPAGIIFHLYLLTQVSGYSVLGAIVASIIYRGMLAVPYIHINIFQHIGLPMYSPDDRPARVYQMSSGCLNLSSNPLLNFAFGHSLINCHVEHHLYPHLSDNMCRIVKPLVSDWLRTSGMPYQERTYSERLQYFLAGFEKLMVDAPAITHFMGLQ